jgi:ribosomal 30S subunit maturation factor RimM
MMSEHILIGKIKKTFGEDGNVVLKLLNDFNILDFNFFFIEINTIHVPFKVENIKNLKRNNFAIKLQYIDNKSDASEIINNNVFIESIYNH